jgi:hypothetical protein
MMLCGDIRCEHVNPAICLHCACFCVGFSHPQRTECLRKDQKSVKLCDQLVPVEGLRTHRCNNQWGHLSAAAFFAGSIFKSPSPSPPPLSSSTSDRSKKQKLAHASLAVDPAAASQYACRGCVRHCPRTGLSVDILVAATSTQSALVICAQCPQHCDGGAPAAAAAAAGSSNDLQDSPSYKALSHREMAALDKSFSPLVQAQKLELKVDPLAQRVDLPTHHKLQCDQIALQMVAAAGPHGHMFIELSPPDGHCTMHSALSVLRNHRQSTDAVHLRECTSCDATVPQPPLCCGKH